MSEKSIMQPNEAQPETHKLGSVLRRIVDQIDDVDRSNSETLKEMQDRLSTLSGQTNQIKISEKNPNVSSFEHIESKIEGLSDRIEIVSQGRAISAEYLEDRIEALANKLVENEEKEDDVDGTQAEEKVSADDADITFVVTDDIDVSEDLDIETIHEELSFEVASPEIDKKTIAQESERQTLQPEHKEEAEKSEECDLDLLQQMDHKIVAPDIDPVTKIDTEELASIAEYISPEVSSQTKKDSAKEPKSHQHVEVKSKVTDNLEERFAVIATKLEETLIDRENDFDERIEISKKFEDLASKFESWLQSNNESVSIEGIEQRIESLSEYVQKAESHSERIDVLEQQIVKLIDLVESSRAEAVSQKDLNTAFEDIASRILEEKSVKIADIVATKVGETVTQSHDNDRLDAIQDSISALNSDYYKKDDASENFAAFSDTLESMSGRLETIEKRISNRKSNRVSYIKKNSSDLEQGCSSSENYSNDFYREIEGQYQETSIIEDLDQINQDLEPQNFSQKIFNKDKDLSRPSYDKENDSYYVEAARYAAKTAAQEGGGDSSRFLDDDFSGSRPSDVVSFQSKAFFASAKDFLSAKSFNTVSVTIVGAFVVVTFCIGILFFESSQSSEKYNPEYADASKEYKDQLSKIGNNDKYSSARLDVQQSFNQEVSDININSNISKKNSKAIDSSNEIIETGSYVSSDKFNNQVNSQVSGANIEDPPLENKEVLSHKSPQGDSAVPEDQKVQILKVSKSKISDTYFKNKVIENGDKAKDGKQDKVSLKLPQTITDSSLETMDTNALISSVPDDFGTSLQRQNDSIDRYKAKAVKTASLLPEEIGSFSLRSAAVNGNSKAQFAIAIRYMEGQGVSQNYNNAAKWFKKAAAQSFAPAQYYLGALYERGRGIKKDIGSAKTWYKRSAEQGNIKAMHNLGVLYMYSVDTTPDYYRAVKWFKRAASYGLADSQYNLGVLYKSGLGEQKDLVSSYKWFSLAHSRGDQQAAKQLLMLKTVMTRDKVFAAEVKISNWRQKHPDPSTNLSDETKSIFIGQTRSMLSDKLVLQAQTLLVKLGYNVGQVDGRMGPKTRSAIREFQDKKGLPVTGQVTSSLVSTLDQVAKYKL